MAKKFSLTTLFPGLAAPQHTGLGVYSTLTGPILDPLPPLNQPFLHTPAIFPGAKAGMFIGGPCYVLIPQPLYTPIGPQRL